jgi:hypothetical protein
MDRGVQNLFRGSLVFGAALDNLATTVKTVSCHMVTTVSFTAHLVYRQGRASESIVGTTHTATGTRLFAFLDCHFKNSCLLIAGL